jgi:hypothetical protein
MGFCVKTFGQALSSNGWLDLDKFAPQVRAMWKLLRCHATPRHDTPRHAWIPIPSANVSQLTLTCTCWIRNHCTRPRHVQTRDASPQGGPKGYVLTTAAAAATRAIPDPLLLRACSAPSVCVCVRARACVVSIKQPFCATDANFCDIYSHGRGWQNLVRVNFGPKWTEDLCLCDVQETRRIAQLE